MIVLHDPDTLLHETVELLGAKVRPALESPDRIKAIVKSINDSDHRLQIVASPLKSEEELQRLLTYVRATHREDYIKHLETVHRDWVAAELIGTEVSVLPECFAFTHSAKSSAKPPKDIYARAGYYAFDMSSGIMDKTYPATMSSANLAVKAVEMLGQDATQPLDVLALCRPPGHHCDGLRAGGYCYVNNAAVAISAWRGRYPDTKIGILDVDFHHGNGTQEIFYRDAQVLYTSIHGEDEFPYYTGAADERGAGDAVGTNLNLPLATGSSSEEYMQKLDVALAALSDFDIRFLVVSLGFDTFHLDPLGSFKIDADDYAVIGKRIRAKLGGVPAVILLEGGYVLEHLGANTLAFLSGWERPGMSNGF